MSYSNSSTTESTTVLIGASIDSYCVVTTNNSSSCSWISNTNTLKEHEVDSVGTYYVFAKDKKGNISDALELVATLPPFGQKILKDNHLFFHL